MANDCYYEMKIKGSKKAIKRVVECLNAYYDYGKGKPKSKHFFRVFECNEEEMVDNKDGTFTKFVWGDCAWSISSCMLDGEWSYYNDVKSRHADIFIGTTLAEQSKDCEIEIFSEEPGVGFSEHYIYKNGECLCNECVETEYRGYDKKGKLTTDINWEKYDGDYVIFNPNKYGVEEGFRWEI